LESICSILIVCSQSILRSFFDIQKSTTTTFYGASRRSSSRTWQQATNRFCINFICYFNNHRFVSWNNVEGLIRILLLKNLTGLEDLSGFLYS